MTSTNDLAAYAELSTRVAALTDQDDLTITPADFPELVDEVTPFDRMVIDTSFQRMIGGVGDAERPFELFDRTFGFEGFAQAEHFRRVGLWLLHVLFSGRDWAGLALTHPTSRAQWFYVDIERPIEFTYGLKTDGPPRYSAYEYAPQEVVRHPFAEADMAPVHRVDARDRPLFSFGWSRPDPTWEFDIEQADQIIFTATPEGVAAMAALLMDMAHPTLGREEINMEPPIVGFAGTQHRSIEARFWLPKSLAFYCDTVDELKLPPKRSARREMYRDAMAADQASSSSTI